jgi:PhzF family phenazine biosynthesis protein
MKIPIFTVDAFTDKPFSGNPAGVCVLDSPLEEKLMQNIAFEMNLSETAFLNKKNDGAYSLRWFTPVVEVDLCGHATLASSHILWETGKVKKSSGIEFNTKSGILKAGFNNGGNELDFPLIESKPIDIPKGIVKAIGVEPVNLFRTQWNYIAELDSEKTVRSVKPDFDLLRALEAWGTIITSRASKELAANGYDFVSRFFAPAKGVKEDPVTGSAHCALAPYWMNRLGKNIFKAYQASERGGTVGVRVDGDRVFLSGSAVTVLSGTMNV